MAPSEEEEMPNAKINGAFSADDDEKLPTEALPEPVSNADSAAAAEPSVAISIDKADFKANGKDAPEGDKTWSSTKKKANNTTGAPSFWRLTAFYFFVLLFLLFVLIFFSFSKPSPNKSDEIDRQQQHLNLKLQNRSSIQYVHCTTASCQAASQSIAASMDFGADPCVDFYNYSCGGWSAHNNAENFNYLIANRFTLLADKVNSQLKDLLNSTSSSTSKSVALATELYQTCLSWQKATSRFSVPAEQFEPLRQEMVGIFGSEWPILGKVDSAENSEGNHTDTFSSSPAQVQSALIEALFHLFQVDSTPIVDFFIDVDLANRTGGQPLFYFTVPSSFTELRPLYSDKKTYANAVATLNRVHYLAMIKFFEYSLAHSNLTKDESEQKFEENFQEAIAKRSNEVSSLEEALVLASLPSSEQPKSTQESLHHITLRELNELEEEKIDDNLGAPVHFNWTLLPELFIKQYNLNYSLTQDTIIAVSDLDYFRKLPAILTRTPLPVLFNYLGAKFTSAYHQTKLYSTEGSTENWCLQLVTGLLDRAVSRLYLEDLVGIQKAKEGKTLAEEMVARLRRSFRRLLATDQLWLDEPTRARALEKEAATRYTTGFPDWILDDAALDEHYGLDDEVLEKIMQGSESSAGQNFLETVLALKRHRIATLASRKSGFLTRSVKLGATNINAFAIPYANQIILPAALLQPPLFDAGRPAYLNLASLGSVVGHEAVHHFDYNGRSFGPDGSLLPPGTSWWTQATSEHYEAAAKCYVKQYDSVVDQWTGKRLRGNATLKENMADMGAVLIAYGAVFEEETEVDNENATVSSLQLLPGKLETFTPEQLFFVTYAQTWCSHYDAKEILAYQIDSDSHAPERYRVNLPLASFAPFSAAFGCPAEGVRSVMHAAKNRCA